MRRGFDLLGKPFASGTVTVAADGWFYVANLTFTPKVVLLRGDITTGGNTYSEYYLFWNIDFSYNLVGKFVQCNVTGGGSVLWDLYKDSDISFSSNGFNAKKKGYVTTINFYAFSW